MLGKNKPEHIIINPQLNEGVPDNSNSTIHETECFITRPLEHPCQITEDRRLLSIKQSNGVVEQLLLKPCTWYLHLRSGIDDTISAIGV